MSEIMHLLCVKRSVDPAVTRDLIHHLMDNNPSITINEVAAHIVDFLNEE
jgi:hypothetical protein